MHISLYHLPKTLFLVVLLISYNITLVISMIRLTRKLSGTATAGFTLKQSSIHHYHNRRSFQNLAALHSSYETVIISKHINRRLVPSRLFCSSHEQTIESIVEDTYSSYSSEEVSVDHLLSNVVTKSHISSFWIDQLRRLQRPVAKSLIAKINPNNVLGYESYTGPPKKGTLLENIIQWKSQHNDKVILTRVGEFYEAYGVDALMLINYAGLNAMAGAAKAGCPIRNVQATLDALTQAGLSVAVYEEISQIESGRGGSLGGSSGTKMNLAPKGE